MNFGLLGQVAPQEMRRQRVRDIISKYGCSPDAVASTVQIVAQPNRDQEDDGRFVSKFFDMVANKQYQQLYCQYNQIMFAKLLNVLSFRELSRGDFLYKKGDLTQHFYFVLKGKIELVVESGADGSGEFKFSKNVDEYEFFGLRSSSLEARNDNARIAAEKCWVIQILRDPYDSIVKKTQLSVSEQKIDFLLRYVPKLRAVTRTMIEELEVFFIKMIVTQGYVLQKQDEQEDYIYFIYRGRCRIFINTQGTLPAELVGNRKHIVIGQLKRGDCFGEESALNDVPNPFSVEAVTKEVHLYKILRGHFIQYFGGMSGDPVTQMRANILLNNNWLRGKVEFIRDFLINADQTESLEEALEQLQFRNDEESAKLKPTKSHPKEVSFIKNNPREKELQQLAAAKEAANGGESGAQMTAADIAKMKRQQEIEALKKSLLAPLPQIPSAKGGPAPVVGGFLGFNKQGAAASGQAEEGEKFNKVMDWGTPRLVTKNRALVMDQKQIQQRAFLNNIASIRKGPVAELPEEKKSDFKPVTVNNFRAKLLAEEKEMLEEENGGVLPHQVSQGNGADKRNAHLVEDTSKPTAASTYPPTLGPAAGIRPLGALPTGIEAKPSSGVGPMSLGGGGGILGKLRNQNEDEMVNKLKQSIGAAPTKPAGGASGLRRLPI